MNIFQNSTDMRAIIIDQEYSNLSDMLHHLYVGERPVREPKENELLIKITGAPCNPSDIAFLRGMYQIKKDYPAVPGFEGAGIVIKTGEALKHLNLEGKRVSCFVQENSDGTWAEYATVNYQNCIVLKDNFPLKEAPVFFINPLTAFGLMEQAIEKNVKTIVQNAAAGQVGNFIRCFAREAGIKVINIVRRPAHSEQLLQQGEEYVLNMRDKEFPSRATELIQQLNPLMVFDAVGGDHTSFLLEIMPKYSEIIVYGGLSGSPVNVDILKLIFDSKKICGFNLGDWINSCGKEKFTKITDQLQNQFIDGKLKTRIQKIISFEEIQSGLYQYLTKMSEGKIIISPEKQLLE